MILYLPGNQYFSKRLTNEGKLKCASKFQKKFRDALTIFRNFLRLKSNQRPRSGHIRLRAQESVSLSLLREWAYNDKKVAGFGMMDLWMAPANADHDTNSRDLAFFTYIQRMQKMPKPSLSNPCIWLWVHNSKEGAKQSADFVK